MAKTADMIIVGGGLSGLITAWRCLHNNPELKVTIITDEDNIGGDQTWAFNHADILPELAGWFKPFIVHEWPAYTVKFPKMQRALDIPYCSSNSEKLRECVQPYIDDKRLILKLNTAVSGLALQSVTLENGKTIDAHYVVDARGFKPFDTVTLGYKNITARTIRTQQPHGIINPIVMDADVPQTGGYQYIYCLPFSDTEVLIESICYAGAPSTPIAEQSDTDAIISAKARIDAYVQKNGWKVDAVLREVDSVLPVTIASDMEPESIDIEDVNGATRIGMRGGYYHAITGHTIAQAIRSANVIGEYIQADNADFARAAAREMNQHELDHYYEESFLRSFARILFRAVKPEQRYSVFQHLYTKSDDLVARFGRNQLERNDKIKLLMVKPPISMLKTIKALRG